MNAAPGAARGRRWLAWALIPAGILVFVVANAHLVYVAFQSNPECVAHKKVPDGEAGYSAARSDC